MNWTDKRVLVTGGNGFVGSKLVEKLVDAGARVKVLSRKPSKPAEWNGREVEWLTGNVFDPQIAEKAMAGMEVVFHLASPFRDAKSTDETFRAVNVDSTRILARLAAKTPGFQRFVHVSTVGVHGHIENPPANEGSAFGPGDIYQETKLEAELWIREFAKSNQLPLTVIRPAPVIGPGDRRMLKLFKMAKLPVVPIIGFGQCLFHFVHVDDLAEGMMHLALHPQTQGEFYICGNPESITLKDMVRNMTADGAKPPRFMRFPAWPFFALGYLCEKLWPPLGISPPIYRRRVAFYTKDRSFDTRKFRDLLAFSFRYDNKTALQETAKWYRKAGWL